MSRSRPQKFKAVQSVQPVVVMDDDDLDDDENCEGTVHMIHALQPGEHPRKRVPRCSVLLAGHKVDALIDTGASINVIATSVLQRIPFQPHLRPTTTQVYTFGSSKPLPLAGVFTTLLSHEDQSIPAKVFVTTMGSAEYYYINRPVRDTIPNILKHNDLHQKVWKALSRRKDRNDKMSRKRGAKERDICVGDTVLVKCRKGGSKFVLPFQKDPWIVSDVRGTMITAKRGPESITQNILFYKKVYASDFPVPIDFSSGDQDYDDVMSQSSGFETNDAFLDGGLCSDVQNPGGSMALDHGSGNQLVEESITSGSGLAGPVTSTRGDGPYNLRPRPQCSTRFRDFVVN
ncbi:hypothetical protein NDU88_006235 [Pleurodeles waltl]|uniref:Peptidase A2 domain-containing protein n=1 Tax=Pleurodeles waltl TaxID=8319 RepID=A0AAV7WA06_PLEWA|nr:hypothetical protein NDU88_006235 [Pleurodeles waltl]